MARNLAKQFAPPGVTINSVSPGVIGTKRKVMALEDPDYFAKVPSATPTGRFGQSIETAVAISVLWSSAAAYFIDVDLPIDGGMRR